MVSSSYDDEISSLKSSKLGVHLKECKQQKPTMAQICNRPHKCWDLKRKILRLIKHFDQVAGVMLLLLFEYVGTSHKHTKFWRKSRSQQWRTLFTSLKFKCLLELVVQTCLTTSSVLGLQGSKSYIIVEMMKKHFNIRF